jgi:hypothetical protein
MRTLATRHSYGVMTPFLSFRASRAGVFSDLSAGAFLAPSAFSRKRELRSPPQTSHKNTVPCRQSLQKRHHYPSGIMLSIQGTFLYRVTVK